MWGCFVSPWLVPYTQGVHQNGCYVHPDLVSRQTKQAFNPHKSLSFGSVSIFLSLLLHRIVLSYSRLLPLCKTLLRRSESWIGPWRSAVTDVVYCALLRVEHVVTCQRLAFFPCLLLSSCPSFQLSSRLSAQLSHTQTGTQPQGQPFTPHVHNMSTATKGLLFYAMTSSPPQALPCSVFSLIYFFFLPLHFSLHTAP